MREKMLISPSSQWIIEAALIRAPSTFQQAFHVWLKSHGPLTTDSRRAIVPDELVSETIKALENFKDACISRLENEVVSEYEILDLLNDIDRVKAILDNSDY